MGLWTASDVAAPSGRERWHAFRDRVLASAGFQRWCARFWLTRPIARRRARALFDLCAGFVYSQILSACVRVRVCEVLAEGPQTIGALSRRLSLPTDATERLLRAAASLRLVERRGANRYGLGALGAAMLGNPGIAAMVQHHALLYADLADPVALLRGELSSTALGGYWPYAATLAPAALTADQVAGYSALMSISQSLVANEVLDAYRLDRHECLLDVGGGDGTFLVSVAARAPALKLRLFDLPAVAARARARFEAVGLSARATATGGSFFTDDLPRGADAISLVRVLHDHGDAAAGAILRAVRRALPPGGTVLIAEPMAAASGAPPASEAYFSFYLLAMGSGRPRDCDEMAGLLGAAGFRDVRFPSTTNPLLTGLVTART